MLDESIFNYNLINKNNLLPKGRILIYTQLFQPYNNPSSIYGIPKIILDQIGENNKEIFYIFDYNLMKFDRTTSVMPFSVKTHRMYYDLNNKNIKSIINWYINTQIKEIGNDLKSAYFEITKKYSYKKYNDISELKPLNFYDEYIKKDEGIFEHKHDINNLKAFKLYIKEQDIFKQYNPEFFI